MRQSLIRIVAALSLLFVCSIAFAEDDGGFTPALADAMKRQDALVDKGEHERAVREARAGSRAGTPDAYYLLGRALGNHALTLKRAGDDQRFRVLIEEAREAFWESKELGGLLYAPALLGLARCARFEADLEEAEKELRNALRIAPGFKAALLELSQVLWERGLHADAELELRRLLEKHPDDIDARMLLGTLKTTRRRWSEAEREFRAVLVKQPDNVAARKLLAANLMYQEKFKESASHFEVVRRAIPKDEESYITLFHIYRRMRQNDKAKGILRAITTNLAGTEAANRAQNTLDELEKNPEGAEGGEEVVTPGVLVSRIENGSDDERTRSLAALAEFELPALPAVVYRMLEPDEAPPRVRTAAIKLIGAHGDPRTLALLEIMMFHPRERETAKELRRAVAHAIAVLPTQATVPLLYVLLDDGDIEVREEAVRGIARRTGKWFRTDLEVTTDAENWPAERQAYSRWWVTPTASLAKAEAMDAMKLAFGHLRRGKPRLTQYALVGMDDPTPKAWMAGYSLFRELSGTSWGSENGDPGAQERTRIASEARRWHYNNRDPQ